MPGFNEAGALRLRKTVTISGLSASVSRCFNEAGALRLRKTNGMATWPEIMDICFNEAGALRLRKTTMSIYSLPTVKVVLQ